MLVLPARRPQHFEHDASIRPSISPLHVPSPSTCSNNNTSSTMTNMAPALRLPNQCSRKPRLTLDTVSVPSLPPGSKSGTALCMSAVTESPTRRNTYSNAFETASLTISTTGLTCTISPRATTTDRLASPISASTSMSTTSSSCSDDSSLFQSVTPYTLSVGSHSILRNSPLPQRHAVGTRPPRIYFPVAKKVGFDDGNLVQYISEGLPRWETTLEPPSDASDTENSPKRKHDLGEDDLDDIAQRREVDELPEENQVASSPVYGRRKRRREWIWRPHDNDILEQHHCVDPMTAEKTLSPTPAEPIAIDLVPEDIPLPLTPSPASPTTTAHKSLSSVSSRECLPVYLPATRYTPPTVVKVENGANECG